MPEVAERAVAEVGRVLRGKEHHIRLAITCLLGRGHLLIEGLSGMGKTTLAQALAKLLGLSYNRIQFTSDILPADILGVAVFQRDTGGSSFTRDRCSARWCLQMRSIAPHPRARAPCSRLWKNDRCL